MGGEDQGDEKKEEDTSSPGGAIVETLSNMGTVSALTMEKERFNHFEEALSHSDENIVREGISQGATSGLSMLAQQWITALQLWFGGWLVYKYPNTFDFRDFNIALVALLFSVFGLGMAFQDIADRKKTEMSASRIFYLIDRQSEIDPLSEEGKTVDTSIPRKSKVKTKSIEKKRKSIKKKKSAPSLKNITEEHAHEADKSATSNKKNSKRSSKKLLDDVGDNNTNKNPKSSKKKRSSKKLLDDADDNDTDKKPKSKSSKKKGSSKKLLDNEDDNDTDKKTSKKKKSSKKNLNVNEDGKKTKSSKKKKSERDLAGPEEGDEIV